MSNEPTEPPSRERVDPEFRALPLAALADAALGRARAGGAEHADLRVERIVTQSISLRDGGRRARRRLDHGRAGRPGDRRRGLGVRLARRAHPGAGGGDRRAGRGGGPHAGAGGPGTGASGPTSRCTATRSGCRPTRSTRSRCPPGTRSSCSPSGRGGCSAADGVDHVRAGVARCARTSSTPTWPAPRPSSSGCGSRPSLTATAVDRAAGGFETMDSLAPPVRPGLGVPDRRRLGLRRRAGRRSPSCWPRRRRAPSVAAGRYDLVIDPTNLWLTIHESVGHATEYDRAIGYEAAYAGTSFATPDQLGTLRYGSDAHARHRRPDRAARAGHHRLRRRRRRHHPVGPRPRRRARRLPARPHVRPPAGA